MAEPEGSAQGRTPSAQLKARLVADLTDARQRLRQAEGTIREGVRLPQLVRREVPRGLGVIARRHPVKLGVGAALAGLLVARAFTRKPRARKHPLRGALKGLIIASAGSLLKPALQEILLRELRRRLQPPPSPPSS